MKAFYKIVVLADSQFSEMGAQEFFKSIVKNAKRRASLMAASSKQKRNSAGKNRPKNLKYGKSNKKTCDAVEYTVVKNEIPSNDEIYNAEIDQKSDDAGD